MEWEQQAADELGLHWHVRMHCPAGAIGAESPVCVQSVEVKPGGLGGGIGKLRRWVAHRRAYAQWVKQQAASFDVLMLRYYVHDPFQLALARSLDKPVFFVHHTKEVDELASAGGIGGLLRSSMEQLIGGACLRSARGSIAVTPEILSYEFARGNIPQGRGLVYPNGIRVGTRVVDDARTATPEFLFVASEFHPWHGLDLLLDALELSEAPLVLHLVGETSDIDRVRAQRDGRIILHGHVDGQAIRTLAARCHAGLSSFALQRKGMSEACTLKVREYLDFGLPVFAGHRDVFPADFPCYRIGSVNVSEMLEFAMQCGGMSRHAVAALARPYIDKKALLSKLYSELQAEVSKYISRFSSSSLRSTTHRRNS